MTTTTTRRAEPAFARPRNDPDIREDDFAELVRRVKRAGLLDRQPSTSLPRLIGTAAALGGGWAVFFLVGNSWWQLITAMYLAVAFTQVSFLAHDAGHRQVFRSKRANELLLLGSGNLGVGISGGWWFAKHNKHHAHPNNLDLDPDVQIKILAYSQKQALAKSGLARFLVARQHLMFFPLLCLEGFWLHIGSASAIIRPGSGLTRPSWERAALGAHFVFYASTLLLVLSPGRALAFIAIHQMLFGLYLGSTFAPNHKGMAMFSESEPTFLERQVLASRNVRGGLFVDFLLGGLNYQIEHHLFPAMPRCNLRRAQEVVKPFCKDTGLRYEERTMCGSYRAVVGHLRLMSNQV